MDGEESTSKGLMAQMKALGRAGWQETQRNAHMASLKARIEKLKLVDVHKAQYALGRKAYSLRIAPEKFVGEYDAIDAIEKSIADKRAGVPADHGASNIQLVKGAAMSVKMKAEAEGMELKLKQMFVALGSVVSEFSEAVGLESEMDAMRSVNSQIEELDKEYTTLSQDHVAQGELKGLSASLAKEVGAKSKAAWVGSISAFKRRFPQRLALPVVTGVLLVLIGASYLTIKKVIAAVTSNTPKSEEINDPEASSTPEGSSASPESGVQTWDEISRIETQGRIHPDIVTFFQSEMAENGIHVSNAAAQYEVGTEVIQFSALTIPGFTLKDHVALSIHNMLEPQALRFAAMYYYVRSTRWHDDDQYRQLMGALGERASGDSDKQDYSASGEVAFMKHLADLADVTLSKIQGVANDELMAKLGTALSLEDHAKAD